MIRTFPECSLPLLVAVLLITAPIAAGQENHEPNRERSGSATIRGTVSVRLIEESAGQHSRDVMREMYSTKHTPDDASTTRGPATEEGKRSGRIALYLESSLLDHQAYRPPENHPLLDQRNLEFHPRVLPILVGTTVDFPNRDNLFHNVFSYSQTKEFDLGRYPRNDSRSVTFDQPGVVRVYCDIHAHMSATILVLRNPYFTVPSETGAYALQHIPEGKYTLVCWYDRDVVERRAVELKAGETLEVNFSF
jgi:plastocyanin